MDRRSTSILLLPLLAALALFYPVANRRSEFGSTQTLTSAATGGEVVKAPGKVQEWHRGRLAVKWFFGRYGFHSPPAQANDPRQSASLHFLIMTVPDPVESGLPHVFDRYMASLQAAVQTRPYFLSNFDLPWQDCLHRKGDKEGKEETAEDAGKLNEEAEREREKAERRACNERRFAKEPGFLLLSSPTKLSSTTNEDHTDLLLVYLVGETATSGVHKRALKSALTEIARFCDWWKEDEDPVPGEVWPDLPTCKEKEEIRVLGPSYSGSEQSLDLVLSSWIEAIAPETPNVKIVSGSATAIDFDVNDLKKGFPNTRLQLGDRSKFTFSSMELPDTVSQPQFFDYLARVQPCGAHLKIALLHEGGTAYGYQPVDPKKPGGKDSQPADPGKNSGCDVRIEKTFIQYPLHISQLRAFSEKLRLNEQETTPQPQLPSRTLPLTESLEDAGTRRDISTFSAADAVTAEQVMANLLSTISREGYNYVGIVATDVRDTMFLAQEVREHVPATVLFAFNSDLLFLHPEINQSLRGMLIVTSYPLATANQLWSVPTHPSSRQQFPDDTAEGVYNAALVLLDADDRVVEYNAPFVTPPSGPGTMTPPLWITVVGRDRLWPVSATDVASFAQVQGYTYQLSRERAGEPDQSSWFQSFYREATLVFVTVFGALCIAFCLPLLKRFDGYTGHGPSTSVVGLHGTIYRGRGWHRRWFDRALGESVAEKHRCAGELFLLASCASLVTFLTVLITALLIPATVLNPSVVPEGTRSFALALTVIVGSVILLVLGGVSLLRALRIRPDGKILNDEPKGLKVATWGPIAAASLSAVILAVALSGQWISQARVDPHSALFSSVRSLDLSSGVSALLPLLLVSMAGFLWGVSSFRRTRQLDGLENKSGFLTFGKLGFGEFQALESELRYHLSSASLKLPGAWLIVCLALVSNVYVWGHVVRSLERSAFYWLMPVSYFFVSLALWYAMLRFWCVWNRTQLLLRHLSLVPLPAACKRFRKAFPTLPKIDLASSAAELAHLECSVVQARTLHLEARSAIIAAGIPLRVVGDPQAISSSALQKAALQHLGGGDTAFHLQNAITYLELARKTDADGRWRDSVTSQWASQEALSRVAADTATALENSWWPSRRGSERVEEKKLSSSAENIFSLGEEFLAGRVAHFLACVFPQMQNLVFTALAGLLLLLFAVSSYPFQPRNLLLLFNWVVILIVVCVAMWVFVQMNRDPVLSNLNGTKAGKISWDWEFFLRIFTYGVVPILALLGTQFPDSVGQILSRILPSEAMHR